MGHWWRLAERHSLELASIGLPLVLLLLNLCVKRLIGVLNAPFLGADLAFCGVSVASAGTVRLMAALLKGVANPAPRVPNPAPLASALLLSFLLMFCWVTGWVLCLGRGIKAGALQKVRAGIKEMVENPRAITEEDFADCYKALERERVITHHERIRAQASFVQVKLQLEELENTGSSGKSKVDELYNRVGGMLNGLLGLIDSRIQRITVISVFIGAVVLHLATNYAWYSFP